MWRELDIRAMKDFSVLSPSLDIGCGDGIFSFIRAGGGFDLNYDAFRLIDNLDQFFQNVDVFDTYSKTDKPDILNKPSYQIDLGFDHKDNLLSKANQLGLYHATRQGDANESLPFHDNEFNSIFSNIIYWLNKPEQTIKEISRILAPGGTACLMLPNSVFPEYSFYNQLFVKTRDPKWQFLEKLDRGRFADNVRQARKEEDWMQIFDACQLEVVSHKRHLSSLCIQMWDIGLRPLFPVLLKMANAIEEKIAWK